MLHHKQAEETAEESHIQTNFQRRKDNFVQAVYEQIPDNKARHDIIHHLHEIGKLLPKALEHKE